MVKFRMSMKSDKSDGKPHHISIPPKDAIAIVPPKKVIKALYDYQPPESGSGTYLAFFAGDFLHVVGRENDEDWYEACNPLQGTRGLVPVKFFETVGKQARNSAASTKSDSYSASAGHDSGYADNSPSRTADAKPMRMSKTMGGRGGAMVYGVVMYDFKAERPDELEAKEGEAIIVIAQSNPEWFVAKPITRLGGPGLIPVSFIEIRDMTTGQPVPDPQEAVKRAGVPKVEEWKKMAADYKNGSIPLGKLDSGQSAMNAGMARMSLGQQQQSPYPQSGYAQTGGQIQGQQQQYMQRSPQLQAPISAKVPRYCYADEIFWFIVEAQMEDGRHWCLQRVYQDFYDLQINLIQEYPVEAGNVKGSERTLPYMPGPVTYVTDNISNGRRANLDEYIRNLLKLGPHITKGYLVRKFFAPRQGDYELDPDAADSYRLSSASQDSPNGASSAISPQSSAGNLSQGQSSAFSPTYQQQQRGVGVPGAGQPQGHYRTGSMQQSVGGTPGPGAGGPTNMKIKVWFEQDNCVIIRMPPQFSYVDLYTKLEERRALERLPDTGELEVLYRDEADGRLYPLANDDELQMAVQRNPKLTLHVRVIGSGR